ncbi:hypothetical protein DER45DRAFT_248059 [Fusarium avenaceum]|nr:hypothetical protein DER45DRAFT_248059 [Fusarium avenaceum]
MSMNDHNPFIPLVSRALSLAFPGSILVLVILLFSLFLASHSSNLSICDDLFSFNNFRITVNRIPSFDICCGRHYCIFPSHLQQKRKTQKISPLSHVKPLHLSNSQRSSRRHRLLSLLVESCLCLFTFMLSPRHWTGVKPNIN